MALARHATTGLLLSLALLIGAGGQGTAQTTRTSTIPSAAFCPSVFILPLTDSITILKQNFERVTDSASFRASLDTATISCITEESAFPTLAEISFTGIAETDNAEIITGFLPVFLTLLDRNSEVLSKQIKESPIVLTPQVSKIAYNDSFESVRIPLYAPDVRAGLRFIIGFQLDKEQLKRNREAAQATP